ncbi:MAG: hypothetical protein Q8934_10730 [Bacillota bacterium]|nr:hypothetical protein [Bacillota bacterium]
MDRISCIAYLLYLTNNEVVKNIAIKLVVGDVSLIQLKKNKMFNCCIKNAEQTLKKTTLNRENVCRFIEEYIYQY